MLCPAMARDLSSIHVGKPHACVRREQYRLIIMHRLLVRVRRSPKFAEVHKPQSELYRIRDEVVDDAVRSWLGIPRRLRAERYGAFMRGTRNLTTCIEMSPRTRSWMLGDRVCATAGVRDPRDGSNTTTNPKRSSQAEAIGLLLDPDRRRRAAIHGVKYGDRQEKFRQRLSDAGSDVQAVQPCS